MQLNHLPTENAEALRSFIHGQESFQAYTDTGKKQFLEEAQASFGIAAKEDPGFRIAIFYLGVTHAQLRQAGEAIQILERLLSEGVEFTAEVCIQLAYAHTKRYTEEDFFQAEELLQRAAGEARRKKQNDLSLLAGAFFVFLYSVMATYLEDRASRPKYVDMAIAKGTGLLKDGSLRGDSPAVQAARFEVLNGLGIAYTSRGQLSEAGTELRRESWQVAERFYAQALRIQANSVRTLQNLGTLRSYQADEALRFAGDEGKAFELFHEAIEFYSRSLEINDHDQYPHYRLAVVYALIGDWDAARRYFASGRHQPGGVSDSRWKRLSDAIDNQDATQLYALES